MDIQHLLEKSSQHHSHLCPRQILGVRIGLAGMNALGLEANEGTKRLLVILETDGCFADGVIAATNCTVGHRTLRVEDYGKVAATFVDTKTGKTLRVAPALDIRQRACACCPGESRHYFAQMEAYQVLPNEQLLMITDVQLELRVEKIVSHPGIRVDCALLRRRDHERTRSDCGWSTSLPRLRRWIVLSNTCADADVFTARSSVMNTPLLSILVFIIATLYASAGFGGASGYLTAMSFFTIPVNVIRQVLR